MKRHGMFVMHREEDAAQASVRESNVAQAERFLDQRQGKFHLRRGPYVKTGAGGVQFIFFDTYGNPQGSITFTETELNCSPVSFRDHLLVEWERLAKELPLHLRPRRRTVKSSPGGREDYRKGSR